MTIMSTELHIAIENAHFLLKSALRPYGAGLITKPDEIHGIGILFRQIGVCKLLIEGLSEPLFIAEMQAASSYAFGLDFLAEEQKVTSYAGCFWDAVAGTYWDGAAQIARKSRLTQNPDQEHEDDFLYVAFLMKRYFLGKNGDRKENQEDQKKMLKQWYEVLEGGMDPRLNLCRALMDRDSEAFVEAFDETAEARKEKLEQKYKTGVLADEQAIWFKPFWPEGLALIRLAEREGMTLPLDCPMVPAVSRQKNPFIYDPNAWRTVEYQPKRK